MSTRCKVCLSLHKAEIEEQFQNGIPSRVISNFVKVNYGETISHASISNHVKAHLYKGENKNPVEADNGWKETMEKRIRGLEVNAWLQRPGGNNHGFSTYSIIDGAQSHALSREEVFLHTFPGPENLEDEYNARVKTIMDEKKSKYPNNLDPEIWEEAREVYAMWCREEEEAQKKLLEEQKIAAAKAEVARIEADRIALMKVLEESAKKQQRQSRLRALRDAALEKAEGIDAEGNQLVDV